MNHSRITSVGPKIGEKASNTHTQKDGKESRRASEWTMYVFFQLIAFQMIYNTANYALDFDFCNEFTFRRQRKHVMNGKNQWMAKIKRAKEPHRATAAAAVVPAFATSVGPIFFSVTHTERTKQSESQNKTKKDMPLDSTRLGESRRCTYLCKRLPYLAILSKSVTINSMMCTEIMRQAAINFRFIDHGLVGWLTLVGLCFSCSRIQIFTLSHRSIVISDDHLSFAKSECSWKFGI